MYNPKDITNVGKFDFDKEKCITESGWNKSFSVGIYKWELKGSGGSLKKGKILVRVTGLVEDKERVFETAQNIVMQLKCGTWSGKKSIKVS